MAAACGRFCSLLSLLSLLAAVTASPQDPLTLFQRAQQRVKLPPGCVTTGTMRFNGWQCPGTSPEAVIMHPKRPQGPLPVIVFERGGAEDGAVETCDELLRLLVTMGTILILPQALVTNATGTAAVADDATCSPAHDLWRGLRESRAAGASKHYALEFADWSRIGFFGRSSGGLVAAQAAAMDPTEWGFQQGIVRAVTVRALPPAHGSFVDLSSAFAASSSRTAALAFAPRFSDLRKSSGSDGAAKFLAHSTVVSAAATRAAFDAWPSEEKVAFELASSDWSETEVLPGSCKHQEMNQLLAKFMSCHLHRGSLFEHTTDHCEMVYGGSQESMCKVWQHKWCMVKSARTHLWCGDVSKPASVGGQRASRQEPFCAEPAFRGTAVGETQYECCSMSMEDRGFFAPAPRG
eukprot:TRINITY_DN3043_c0_g1_i1.p1 TRINITY_DN3043_c0_g1~~TRINITY_DN3043_c0_g1_i1.p1  ORF type:complete len:427 (+),score=74.40 TRINITY_DN3043_c0_g1_i1:63-1283(+)